MKTNLESVELTLRLWRLTYQTYTLLKKSEDQVFEKHGLTTEQYSVLSAIDYFGGPTKVTDIARWLERSTNSVSMIVDRMVKAGLVKRVRDRRDRRVVNVSITNKAENALKPAILAGWEFIQKITSPLAYEDMHTFIKLHDTLRYEILKYLNPGTNIEELARNEDEQHANLMERLVQYASPSTPEAKRQGSGKGKTRRI
jgi:DNA-binding MarR family transcriptional regulator